MGGLRVLPRAEVAPDLLPLWDELERLYPTFRNSWGAMANSPTVLRHIWGALLEMKRESPVAARHFEMAILVVSSLNRCDY